MTDEQKLENIICENVDDKLAKVKYSPDSNSHLCIDKQKCLKCKVKNCTIVCPANVYEWNEKEKNLIVRYENCLECGACRIICDKNAIDWKYPKAGFGVTYKNS